MLSHISKRQTQFSYFDQLLEGWDWSGKRILDFGGNVGGFLVGAGDHIDHDDYWCLDPTQDAIERGRSEFPRAHFVFYNRYSSYFNPNGIRNLPVPDLGLKFDIILAFSVFTHTHRNEMLELVEQLRRMLAPQGVLAFTFFDPDYDQSLSDPTLPAGSGVIDMFEPGPAGTGSLEIEAADERQLHAKWCLFVADELYVEPGKELCQQERAKPGESYCAYFTSAYMKSLFPGATVISPLSSEWQHACILKNTESSAGVRF